MGDWAMIVPAHGTCITRIVLFAVLFFYPAAALSAMECSAVIYGEPSFTEQQKDFTPYDKVFVKIGCDQLDAGNHTLYVNWIHHKKGIVRTEKKSFSVQSQGAGYTAYFWFKLTRQGPIKSTFTNQDFYPGHLGDWVVEAVLGDNPVCSSPFTILESN